LLVKNVNKQISNNRQQLTTVANLKPVSGEFRGPSCQTGIEKLCQS